MRAAADVHVAKRADEKSAADAVGDGRVARVIGARIRPLGCERGGDADHFQPALRRPERRRFEWFVAVRTDDDPAMNPVSRQPRVTART